jgi:FKBP-type peptidyl-prolyl cis-trans isomerase
LSFASQWREGGLEGVLAEDALIRGIRAGLGGTPLTAEDRERASKLLHDAYEAWAAHNKTAATEFLAHNAKEPGVKTTASGLQYVILAKGDPAGPKAAGPNDHVSVQYRGKFLNGTEFDSSYSHGKPAVIKPGMVIAGWREVLPLMSRGSKWRIFVPPDLGYGLTPPPSIPPNSLLIFEIEIVDIEAATAGAGAAQ